MRTRLGLRLSHSADISRRLASVQVTGVRRTMEGSSEEPWYSGNSKSCGDGLASAAALALNRIALTAATVIQSNYGSQSDLTADIQYSFTLHKGVLFRREPITLHKNVTEVSVLRCCITHVTLLR